MVFSDSAGGAGIVEDIDFLLGTNSTSYPIADKTRNINRRFDEAVSLIMQADERWQWDDINQSDSPILTQALVNNQQNYTVSGFTYLKIIRVEVLDINGKYYLLEPIDVHEVQNQSMTEFQGTAGRPLYYDKMGDELWLYPKPSSAHVITTDGLKVYYQRGPSYFTTADTTKQPGFAPLFHRILSLGAALDYAMAKGMNSKISTLMPQLTKLQADLVTFYAGRVRDQKVRMSIQKENYGQDMGYRGSDRVAFY